MSQLFTSGGQSIPFHNLSLEEFLGKHHPGQEATPGHHFGHLLLTTQVTATHSAQSNLSPMASKSLVLFIILPHK